MSSDLPTTRECPQCNAPMKPFMVQSRKPDVDVELDRCYACGGVWFDAGELEITTGRTVIKSTKPSDRYCPKCLIPLLNAELTSGVAVESCRSCKGTYLDARDIEVVTRSAPTKPPEEVTFVCSKCKQRKQFSTAKPTAAGHLCAECADQAEHAHDGHHGAFGSFVAWLRGD